MTNKEEMKVYLDNLSFVNIVINKIKNNIKIDFENEKELRYYNFFKEMKLFGLK